MRAFVFYHLLFFALTSVCSQTIESPKVDISEQRSFAVFITEHSSVADLHDVTTELFNLGYHLDFENVVIDSLGNIETIDCKFYGLCEGIEHDILSTIDFRNTSHNLATVFLGAECSQGAFQSDINKSNVTLKFLLNGIDQPDYVKDITGDFPNSNKSEFRSKHYVWLTE